MTVTLGFPADPPPDSAERNRRAQPGYMDGFARGVGYVIDAVERLLETGVAPTMRSPLRLGELYDQMFALRREHDHAMRLQGRVDRLEEERDALRSEVRRLKGRVAGEGRRRAG